MHSEKKKNMTLEVDTASLNNKLIMKIINEYRTKKCMIYFIMQCDKQHECFFAMNNKVRFFHTPSFACL
jgi:hypothetical protein